MNNIYICDALIIIITIIYNCLCVNEPVVCIKLFLESEDCVLITCFKGFQSLASDKNLLAISR